MRQLTDVTTPNVAVRGWAPAVVIDTRTIPQPAGDEEWVGEPRLVRDHLPAHVKPAELMNRPGEPNGLQAGATLEEERTTPGPMFPAISATGWNPPDPTVAVGPSHIVVCVNSRVTFYTKAGAQQFTAYLDSDGAPGFFEPVGGAAYCFDPKVIYDAHAQRFVIVVLEVYGTTEAWVDLAVSDDSDPNGVWYKYRTDAVTTIGTSTAWWDFPGLGYDHRAYYVTGNLFGLNPDSGYYGFGLRVFDKAPLLTGQPAVYSTLRDSGYVIQPALHYGTPPAAYMVTTNNSTSLEVFAVNDPLGTPTLSSTLVTMPSYSGGVSAPTVNGQPAGSGTMTMPTWRGGKLHVTHAASAGGRNVARWHELATGSWPASGSVTRVQTGDVDAGGVNHVIYPAIASNAAGDLGMAMGITSQFTRLGVGVAGRKTTDPAGRMGVPTLVKGGDSDGGGRWGDYFGVAVDPSDDTTFWAVGEYRGTSSWRTWVSSFSVGTLGPCKAVPDHAGTLLAGGSVAIDVLVNDWHAAGSPLTIQSFGAVGTRGGTVTRSAGTGPGGRDRLVYTAPAGLGALDSFNYVVADGSGGTATAAATVLVVNPATFRVPESVSVTAPGLDAAYYALAAGPTAMPAFASLTPISRGTAAGVNYPSTTGSFAGSGRSDLVGAVFTGYLKVPADDYYTLSVESDDGSKLWVGSTLLINNDGVHGMTEVSAPIGLKAGTHLVRLEFFENTGGAGLIVRWQPLNGTKAVVPATAWVRAVPCPPDFTGQGGLDLNDIFAFLNAWFAGCAAPGAPPCVRSADYNGQNGVDLLDIFAFLRDWFAGCA